MKNVLLIINIVLVAFYLILIIINSILNYDRGKHNSCKYCNDCDASLDSECNYCSNCGKKLDDEYESKAFEGSEVRYFICIFKCIFKKRDKCNNKNKF